MHYAANPTYKNEMGHVPEMEQHTLEVLRELDEKRPHVVLIPDRDNSFDPYAVVMRCGGQHIGYVDRDDVGIFHKLLKHSRKKFLTASISRVEADVRGKLYLTLEAEEGLDKTPLPWAERTWPEWDARRPLFPTKEVWITRSEAEFMINEVLWPCADAPAADLLEHYLDVWMESSRFDISHDTFQTCHSFIHRFAAHDNPRIRQWAERLDQYRTAFYGMKGEAIRMQWWRSLQQSEAMEELWNKWLYSISYHLRPGLREIDTYLRGLPDQLYSLIGQPDKLFKSLFYRRVPRQVLWGIHTALLLRIRTCRELYIDMRPLAEDSMEYGILADVPVADAAPVAVLPAELQSAQATRLLDKLCQAGLLDSEGFPQGLSGTERSLLAKTLGDRLGITTIWKVFGEWWGIKSETLRASYNQALNQRKSMNFQDRLKEVMK